MATWHCVACQVNHASRDDSGSQNRKTPRAFSSKSRAYCWRNGSIPSPGGGPKFKSRPASWCWNLEQCKRDTTIQTVGHARSPRACTITQGLHPRDGPRTGDWVLNLQYVCERHISKFLPVLGRAAQGPEVYVVDMPKLGQGIADALMLY
jgi:hypothetical protein